MLRQYWCKGVQRMFDDFLVVSAKQIQKMTGQKVGSAERIEVMT